MLFSKYANDCPCKDCGKRHEKCHSGCVDYKAWKDKNQEYSDLRRAEMKRSDTMSEQTRKIVWRKSRWK